ncbi:FkbM family methyltransferase [Leptospira ilyithenensis]|uniref:FkbM family methyltransferase n=1 Tax=Leptospira ilyithenensis TaxID=2484901 RepID=A0A4R9LKA0_9LEPT|nr:FkbM family methyltransferase [Leptospira ilyithenensis]TGN08016.1 FkbM family methyltransferase [Leptospira ilyithenensis]
MIEKLIRKIRKATVTGNSDLGGFLSFSQEGEDMILREIFENKSQGFYVDIGAYDPVRFSNTNYFYQLGWSGINIEPSPDAIERFNLKRTRDINLNFGVSGQSGNLDYYSFEEAALNTFDSERVVFLEKNSPYRSNKKLNIPVLPLAEILSRHCANKQIDFMNIDVEWHELDVLKSNDWNRFRPNVLLVEILNFDFETVSKDPVHMLLQDLGYKFECKTPRTSFYLDTK